MTEQVKKTRKAKRALTDIDFSGDKAHLALVGKACGGPANGRDKALVIKAVEEYSPEFVEKASQIKVTMDIEDFLQKFFGLWESDAELLVRLFGFEPKATYLKDEADEYEQYMQEKLSNFEILKSANTALQEGFLAKYLSGLKEDQYLMLLQDQEIVEKAFEKESVAKATDTSTETNLVENTEVEVGKASVIKSNSEKSMQEEVIAKAAFVELQKALEDQKVELQKALESIKQFEKEKEEAIKKSRFEKIEKAVGKDKATVIAKAALLVKEDSEFEEVVKALAAITKESKAAVDELFVEKGASAEEKEPAQVNLVADILKAQFHTSKKDK